MKEPRVLYVLANCSFPPSEGAHEQSLNLIREISGRGVSCSLIAGFKEDAPFDASEFKKFAPLVDVETINCCRGSYTARLYLNCIAYLLKYRLGLPRTWFPKIIWQDFEVLSVAASKEHFYDCVHVEGVPFLPLVSRMLNRPRIVSTVDAWSLRQKRLFSSSSGLVGKIARGMAWALANVVDAIFLRRERHVHVVSPSDSAYLRSCGVSGAFSIPIMLGSGALSSPLDGSDRSGIYIYGDLQVSYIRDGVYQLLTSLSGIPGLSGDEIYVLGRRRPPSDLVAVTEQLNRRVNFISWVDDVDESMRRAKFILLPDLAGTGLKNRTIAALASGAVVIGTIAAFEGVGVVGGVDSIIYKKPAEAWKAVEYLQNRSSERSAIGEAGRLLALANYAPSVVTKSWLDIYRHT